MEYYNDFKNRMNSLFSETQRPGRGHQKSKYEKKGEKINWAGFGDAHDYATGARGGFLSESNQDNIIMAFFGPSGSGKSWYKQILVKEGWREIKSNTTRKPRGAQDIEYNFYTDQQFADMLKNGKLINTNEYLGEMYGTKIEDFSAPGRAVMLTDITSLNPLKQAAEQFGKNLVLIYTAPAGHEEMERRHRARGTPERIGVSATESEQEGKILQRGDIYTIRSLSDLNSILGELNNEVVA